MQSGKREFKGRGAGEGLAVVNGHQCGVEGVAVVIPPLSREIIMGRCEHPLPGASSAYSK